MRLKTDLYDGAAVISLSNHRKAIVNLHAGTKVCKMVKMTSFTYDCVELVQRPVEMTLFCRITA